MRCLGLDIGDKRIGVAISDAEEILATPLTTITKDNDEEAIKVILELVSKHGIQCILAGMPYSLDGSVGKQASKVMAFVEILSKSTKADIKTWDERLSTIATERLLVEAGTKKNKRKSQRDAVAAAFILQGYLDSLKACD